MGWVRGYLVFILVLLIRWTCASILYILYIWSARIFYNTRASQKSGSLLASAVRSLMVYKLVGAGAFFERLINMDLLPCLRLGSSVRGRVCPTNTYHMTWFSDPFQSCFVDLERHLWVVCVTCGLRGFLNSPARSQSLSNAPTYHCVAGINHV
jgi:hypothetical protein